jgi:hypothetical protein
MYLSGMTLLKELSILLILVLVLIVMTRHGGLILRRARAVTPVTVGRMITRA